MIRIPLYARPLDGDWKLHLVGHVTMPHVVGMPDVIVWGMRFFTRTPIGDYVEAFAWIAPTPVATSSNVKGDTDASSQDVDPHSGGSEGRQVQEPLAAFSGSQEGSGDAGS